MWKTPATRGRPHIPPELRALIRDALYVMIMVECSIAALPCVAASGFVFFSRHHVGEPLYLKDENTNRTPPGNGGC